jgi:hypothetical protein
MKPRIRSPFASGYKKHTESDAPVFHEGRSKHPVSVVAVHYSPINGLTHLDPSEAGSGSSGAERRHYGTGTYGKGSDPMAKMTHFYVRSGSFLPKKEKAVSGDHAYEVVLNNMYDVKADPDGIIKHAEDNGYGSNGDAIIDDIHSAGYDGYVSARSLPGMHSRIASVRGVKGKIPVKQVK